MPSIGATWRQIQQQLEDAGIDPAPGEGRALLRAALGVDNLYLTLHEDDELSTKIQYILNTYSSERLSHKPLAYVLGRAPFMGRDWKVGPGVLIPRPDTETLVLAAAEMMRTMGRPGLLVDVGVGSGAVLGSLLPLLPGWRGVGIDISAEALATARANLAEATVEADLRQGNLLAPLEEKADIIVSNPPYIAEEEWAALDKSVRDYEPRLALVGGADGLDCYRALIPQAFDKLKPGGGLAVEIGHRQGHAVKGLFEQAGFKQVATRPDLAGRPRVVVGWKNI